MKLRPEEITSILRQRIEEFDVETNLAEVGAVLQLGDGIARVHGLENCVALEMLELDHGVVGLAFNLEEDNVGVALFGAVGARSRRATPCAAPARSPRCRSARRCSAASSTRSATRSTARARSTSTERRPLECKAPGVDPAPAGEGAAPDRDQGDRLDDERRPRPARADHRRPLDRQDRDRGRHDPEPARPEREVHLRRRRPEGLDGRAGVRAAARGGRDGVHDDRDRAGVTRPRRSSGWRRSPAPRWASTSSTRASTRSSSTTT